MRPLRLLVPFLVIGMSLGAAATAEAAGRADELLKLVPPDAGITVAIEDLSGHAREFFASPLADGLQRLPAVRAWLASEKFQRYDHARRQIESVLGETVATIRDRIFGDAVVLSLQLPAKGRQDEARGLLLIQVRDRALLVRLVDGINAAQKKNGELTRVVERTWAKSTYSVREFPPKSPRPADYYAILAEKTFAMSNSEELIRAVIDRKGRTQKGLADQPGFLRVREALPERAMASLFVNPRFFEAQVASAPRASQKGEDKGAALVASYLGGVEYAGAALEWRDGLVLHTEEALRPEKTPRWLGHWAQSAPIKLRLDRVPATALAMASLHVDFEALAAIVQEVTPERDRQKLENLRVLLTGAMLGNDVDSVILPRTGPGVLAYLDLPSDNSTPAPILSVDLRNASGEIDVSAAYDNALRMLLAAYALDPKHGEGQLRVESRVLSTARLTTLVPSSPFVYAVNRERLVVATTPEAVRRAIALDAAPAGFFAKLRDRYFPSVESFVAADLGAVVQYAEAHREAIAQRCAAHNKTSLEQSSRDLDQALALMKLFESAYITSTVGAELRSIHRTLGLIAREPAPAAGP